MVIIAYQECKWIFEKSKSVHNSNLYFVDIYPNGYSKKRIWIVFINIRRIGIWIMIVFDLNNLYSRWIIHICGYPIYWIFVSAIIQYISYISLPISKKNTCFNLVYHVHKLAQFTKIFKLNQKRKKPIKMEKKEKYYLQYM